MKEKKLSVPEHFTQQMSPKSQAEMIKYYFHKLKVYPKAQPQVFRALEICLEGMTPKRLLDTVRELRAFSYRKNSQWLWEEWNQKELSSSHWQKTPIFWLWMTAHPNGYIREIAWGRLKNTTIKHKLTFLLLTVNDNVAELRTLAVQLLMSERTFEREELVFSLPFIQRLGGLGHVESRAIQKYMIQLLLDQPEILLEAQQSADLFIYRYAFELSYSTESSIIGESIPNGFKKVDRITLARTFREFVRTAEDKELQVKTLLSHPQTIIRKLASIWCYNHLEGEAAMIPLLLDSAVSIRYLTRDYVMKYFPSFDMRAYYLEQLSSCEVNAIQGLAMLKDDRDKEMMLLRMNDSRKKVRLAVFSWLSCLPMKEQLDNYLLGLADISKDVRRKSEEHLGELYPYFYSELKQELFTQFKTSKETKQQISILNVLTNGMRKEYLFDLFELYPFSANLTVEEEIKQRIYSWEYAWNRKFFVAFTEEEQEQLKQASNKLQLFLFDEY